MEFEIFLDRGYYDLWCVRPKGSRRFEDTIHFSTREQAEHAAAKISQWVKEELASICT